MALALVVGVMVWLMRTVRRTAVSAKRVLTKKTQFRYNFFRFYNKQISIKKKDLIMPIIPRLLVAAAPVFSVQGSASAQGVGMTIKDLPNLKDKVISLPTLQYLGGSLEITNVGDVSHVNFENLEYIDGCPESFPLESVSEVNAQGLKLEKKADQFKKEGDIGKAKRHYEAAHKAYLKATKKEENLKCTEIDVFRKNAERVQGKLKKLPNQEL
jgi:hypothetical protein